MSLTQTCGVCSLVYSAVDARCPRCGFGSGSAAPPTSGGAPPQGAVVASGTVGDPNQAAAAQIAAAVSSLTGGTVAGAGTSWNPATPTSWSPQTAQAINQAAAADMVQTAVRSTGRAGMIIALVVLAIVGGTFFAIFGVINNVTEGISDIGDTVRTEVGTAFEGSNANTATELTEAQCDRLFRNHLAAMFSALAEGRGEDLSDATIAASTAFGPGSREYFALIDIFSNTDVSSAAALGEPKKAMKKAIPLIKKACAR